MPTFIRLLQFFVASAVCWAGVSLAAMTDLSDLPLSSSSTTQVKPNILFILDDSGSMDSRYMPDGLSSSTIGYRNYQCNTIYYNPSINYVIPVTSSGSNINAAAQTAFTSAYDQGYYSYMSTSNSSNKSNLSTTGFSADGNESGRAAYYWTLSNPSTDTSATTLTPDIGICTHSTSSVTSTTTGVCCTTRSDKNYNTSCSNPEYPTSSPATCTAGKTLVWKKVLVGASSGPSGTDERQNFANWYSYYNTRIKMMKAAVGRAFVNVTDAFRVGFMTINPDSRASGSSSANLVSTSNPVGSSRFLGVADFDTSQRTAWYTKLYSQDPGPSTPLRTALAQAGRYFAGKSDGINTGMSPDPVQYSCQQNFSILTTDGYWNGTGGYKLNTAMSDTTDNQDGNSAELDAYNPSLQKFAVSPRPIYDGATALYTWNTASIQYDNTATCPYGTQWRSQTNQFQRCNAPTLTSSNTTFRQDSSDYGATWGTPYAASSCTAVSSGRNRVKCTSAAVMTRTSSNSGSTWTVWAAGTSPCESSNAGTNRRECVGYKVTAARTTANGNNSTPTWTSWADTASCSEDNSGNSRTECRYAGNSAYSCSSGGWANAECTNTNSAVLPLCQQSSTGSWTGWNSVGTCPGQAQDSNGVEILCETQSVTGYKLKYKADVTSKDYSGPGQSGSQVGTTRVTLGSWVDLDGVCYQTAPPLPAGGTVTGGGPPSPPSGCVGGTQAWPCETAGGSTGGTSNTLADVAQYYYKTDLRLGNTSVATTDPAYGTCPGGGVLGGTVDVCADNVPKSGTGVEDDRANWQHMTTFTMGLGLSGCLNYQSDYKTAVSGTFANLRTGASNTSTNPDADCTGSGRSPFANWPTPSQNNPSALDDLWHAAVNGRGQYFSARDPDSVVDGLSGALSGVNARVASAAAAATSNLQPVNGDNFAYTAKYVTKEWTGELEQHEIDLTSGEVKADVVWSAQSKLDASTKNACDNRTIKLFRSGATNNMVSFTWNTYACDGSGNPTGSASTGLNASEQAYFDANGIADEVALLAQYPDMTDGVTPSGSVNQRAAARGANLVNYLRGQRGNEGFVRNVAGKLYRTREHVLGDIINAQPIYVKKPFAEYDDVGYVGFKAAKVGRTPMVYAAANDGMLHAFYSGTSILDSNGGNEAWAFMPTQVLPQLYKIASTSYETQHVFSVDGTPTVGDVFDATMSADCAAATPSAPQNCWKTILVGGLNKGGKGYYALDITDPASPSALWEFNQSSTCYDAADTSTYSSDCHLGYTYSNPLITKLRDGRWVAIVASGHNNVNSPTVTGDGIGYLYVLNAITGKIIYKISTGVGSATTPSGLSHLAGWVEVDPSRNNQTEWVYGADLLGNIWRFDVNDILGATGLEATRVTTVSDASGVPQPITTRPVLTKLNGAIRVYVGTGRYLGSTDLSNTQTQTIWAIRDTLSSSPISGLRTSLAEHVFVDSGSGSNSTRSVYCKVRCGVGDGWFVDLPESGERVSTDMKLQLGTLSVPANTPVSNACNIGGTSRLLFMGLNGLAIGATAPPVGGSATLSGGTLTFKDSSGATTGTQTLSSKSTVGFTKSDSPIVGINIVRLPGGKVVAIVTYADGNQDTVEVPVSVLPPTGKRVSWREVIQ